VAQDLGDRVRVGDAVAPVELPDAPQGTARDVEAAGGELEAQRGVVEEAGRLRVDGDLASCGVVDLVDEGVGPVAAELRLHAPDFGFGDVRERGGRRGVVGVEEDLARARHRLEAREVEVLAANDTLARQHVGQNEIE
jgi:hypothetical protein